MGAALSTRVLHHSTPGVRVMKKNLADDFGVFPRDHFVVQDAHRVLPRPFGVCGLGVSVSGVPGFDPKPYRGTSLIRNSTPP